MTSPGEVQPAKRSPGRPRKTPIAKTAPVAKPAPVAEPEPTKVEPAPVKIEPKFPADERVGKSVADSRWTQIGFDDGRSYRVENGVIVERVS